MNVLVVVAHPDDEAIGCGGTIAKWSAGGHRVVVALPTRRCDPRGVELWEVLLEGFRASCELLGAQCVILENLLDESRAESHLHELHDRIVPLVEDADLVLTHWPHDVNQVHRGVARAVEIATRPFRRRRDVSCFEVPTSTDQGFGGVERAFQPNEYVVLELAHVERKLRALAGYTSELAPGRTPDDLEHRLRARGAEIGATWAEAFVTVRRFR